MRLDGTSEPTNDITMSDHWIKNLQNPIKSKDAANKKYVDDMIAATVGTGAAASATGAVNTDKFKEPNWISGCSKSKIFGKKTFQKRSGY